MRKTMAVAVALWLGGSVLALAGAGAPPPQSAETAAAPEGPSTPFEQLEVEVVLSRYRGQERVAHLPYTLRLGGGGPQGRRAALRAGVEVPVEVTAGSFQYRSVGTNIDCKSGVALEAARAGYHQLSLSVEHSVVIPSSSEVEAPFPGAPMFSTFKIQSDLGLKDGQSASLVSSTDPVTGEVIRIQVTLHVE